jgi:ADP-ribose pyrophosphatase YjhB (NUDIX family)
MENDNRPNVGVATIVVKDDKILLGKDAPKSDVYGLPGGHWESGETLKECSARETKEESGVVCSNQKLVSIYDFYREDKKKSYLTFGMSAEYVSGNLTDLKNEGRSHWDWYSYEDAMKLNLFPPDRILLERFKSGIVYE